MDLNQARTDISGAIKAARPDLLVTTEPASAIPPCVLVGPVTEINVMGGCVYEVLIPVSLIAPSPGDDRAVSWLATNVTDVLEAIPGEVTSADLGSIDVGTNSLPAIEIPATIPVKE